MSVDRLDWTCVKVEIKILVILIGIAWVWVEYKHNWVVEQVY